MAKRIFLLIACIVGAVGCGSGGDGSSASGSSTKAFFSSWTRDDKEIAVDFTGGSFGPTYQLQFINASISETCQCTSVVFSGTETAGSIAVSGCSHSAGPDSGICTEFDNGGSPYTYTKSGVTLTLCDSSGCGLYY